MNHIKLRRVLALLLAAVLCAGLLTACGDRDGEDEQINKNIIAQQGGDPVPFTEEFDTTKRYNTQIVGSTLCIAFNGIQNDTRYKVPYFTAAGDTITVTANATTESERNKTYRVALWKKVDGGAEYVGNGDHSGTMEFTADGTNYTAQFSGLEPGAEYKVTLAYDGRKYYMSGQLSVQGLAGAEQVVQEEDD